MLDALQKGNSLKNPAFWKKLQMAITAMASFLPLLAIFFPQVQHLIDTDAAAKLGAAIGAVVVYLTVATSEKIGF